MESHKNLISVIMPVHNTPADMLNQAIQSILKQTYENFEFLIIDDCSNEETKKVIHGYSDNRIRIIENNDNLGITKSLNIGLDEAQGEFIARMDSDDISLPQRFEKQIIFMKRHKNCIVCGTWFATFDEEKITRIVQKVMPESQINVCSYLFGNENGLCHPTAMFRKEMLNQYRIRYWEEIPMAQDYAMWCKCSRYGEILNVPEVLFHYRVHNQRVSDTKKVLQQNCAENIRKKLLIELFEDVNSKQLQLHEKASSRKRLYKSDIRWYENILIANETKCIYPEAGLREYINQLLDCKKINTVKTSSTISEILYVFKISNLKERAQFLRLFLCRVCSHQWIKRSKI